LAFATFLVWRLRTGACGVGACGFWRYRMPPVAVKDFGVCDFSRLGGYGLALATLALVVFGAYDSYPLILTLL